MWEWPEGSFTPPLHFNITPQFFLLNRIYIRLHELLRFFDAFAAVHALCDVLR